MTSLLLILAFQGLQPPQEKQIGEGKIILNEGVQITLSGMLDAKYSFWDGVLSEAASNLSGGFVGTDAGAAGTKHSDDAFFGRLTLRLDVKVGQVKGLVEVETKSIDKGRLERFGVDDESQLSFNLEQAYLILDNFAFKGIRVYAGVQDVTWRLRPHSEPFFIDLTESEGFFEGTNTNITGFRNTVFRDTLEPVGLRISYMPENAPWVSFDAYLFKVIEDGAPQTDEQLFALKLGATPGDKTLVQAFAVLVTGGKKVPGVSEGKGQDVVTYGVGLNHYLDDQKKLEFFSELFLQAGTFRDDSDLQSVSQRTKIDKDAFAYNLGMRFNFYQMGDLLMWFEAANIRLSGDTNPYNSEDNSFQSYENVNQFLIIEDKEIGLDIDTNLKATKVSIGVDNLKITDHCKNVSVRLDVGRFDLDKTATRPNETTFIPSGDKRLGTEFDLSVKWPYSKELIFMFKGAFLTGSDVAKLLSKDKDDNIKLVLVGTQFKW